VIDEKGANRGVLSREEALELAEAAGLDLIEVSPQTSPPVARIMSFDKFRYETEKKQKKQRLHQKGGDMKQIQISIRAAKNDLEIKARKANAFLEEGHTVEILMRMRGREKANKAWAHGKLQEFIGAYIDPNHKVVMTPKQGMRGIATQIARK